MAVAQAHLAALFNKEGFDLISNYTYGNQFLLAALVDLSISSISLLR